MLRLARELDDALLHLRLNELEAGVVVIKSQGDPSLVAAHEKLIFDNRETDWLCNEIALYWKRVLKRVDMTSRSLVALVENGSCFTGILAELLFAVDRSYMMEGEFEEGQPPTRGDHVDERQFRPTADGQRTFPSADTIPRQSRRR